MQCKDCPFFPPVGSVAAGFKLQEILFPALEYRMASVQYTEWLMIQMRHTTKEGRKPILKSSALTARIPANTAHTLLVAEYALKAHCPIRSFSCLVAVLQPFLLKLHVINGGLLFGIDLLGSVHTFLPDNQDFDDNGNESRDRSKM